MHLPKILAITSLACLALGSCERDKDVIVEKSKTELLTQNNWILVEAYSNTEKGGVRETKDLYSELDECEKDDLVIFSKNNKVTLDQGELKCNEFEPQTKVKEKWVLVSNTQLEYTSLVFETQYEATIIELSETTLHTRVYGTDSEGVNFENTYKYHKAP